MAALAAQGLSDGFRVDAATRRVLLASAAGAGLASVYNVPVAGALYALELTVRPNLRTRRGWGQVGIAVVISVLSTVTAWIFNHDRPIYRSPVAEVTPSGLGWIILLVAVATPIGAGMGVLFGEMKRRVPVEDPRHHDGSEVRRCRRSAHPIPSIRCSHRHSHRGSGGN